MQVLSGSRAGAGGLATPDLRRLADPLEHLPDIARVQRGTEMGGEHQPGVLPGHVRRHRRAGGRVAV